MQNGEIVSLPMGGCAAKRNQWRPEVTIHPHETIFTRLLERMRGPYFPCIAASALSASLTRNTINPCSLP